MKRKLVFIIALAALLYIGFAYALGQGVSLALFSA